MSFFLDAFSGIIHEKVDQKPSSPGTLHRWHPDFFSLSGFSFG
jgi:hypothetical protein